MSMALDPKVRHSLATGDWVGTMGHGSYHTPFIGNGRNAWDAWQMGKPWSAAGHAGLFSIEALGMHSAGKVRGGQIKPVKNAYKLAKAGEIHGDTYKTYLHKPANQLRKGIRSFQRRIDEHQDKLANPRKHWPGWDNLTKKHQQNAISDWKHEIKGFTEHRLIYEGILKNRK